MSAIRNLAICVFRHGTSILVARGFDDVRNEPFLRPLGGAIEFGELAVDALRREIREELGVEIADPVRLGILENRFDYRGRAGHEIVFVFDATFVDSELYDAEHLPLKEPIWDGAARWVDLDESLPAPLCPAGLAALLESVHARPDVISTGSEP